MSKQYASYEKEIVSKTVKIRHTVRAKLNEPVGSIVESLKNVPPNVPLTMVVGDDNNNGYGELIFEEEKGAK